MSAVRRKLRRRPATRCEFLKATVQRHAARVGIAVGVAARAQVPKFSGAPTSGNTSINSCFRLYLKQILCYVLHCPATLHRHLIGISRLQNLSLYCSILQISIYDFSVCLILVPLNVFLFCKTLRFILVVNKIIFA